MDIAGTWTGSEQVSIDDNNEEVHTFAVTMHTPYSISLGIVGTIRLLRQGSVERCALDVDSPTDIVESHIDFVTDSGINEDLEIKSSVQIPAPLNKSSYFIHDRFAESLLKETLSE